MKRIIQQIMLMSALFMGATAQAVCSLHAAANQGNLEEVRAWITQRGIAVDSRDSERRTALYRAARKGHLEVVQFLVSHGADVNAGNNSGKTPLYWAVLKGHFEVVRFLVKHGANVNVQNMDGETPLYEALDKGDFRMANYLISHGALGTDPRVFRSIGQEARIAKSLYKVPRVCFTFGALYLGTTMRSQIKTMPAQELWDLLAAAVLYDCTAADWFIAEELGHRKRVVETYVEKINSRCLEINELIADAQKNGKKAKLDEKEMKKLRLHKDTALLVFSFLPRYGDTPQVGEWARREQVLRESIVKSSRQ